ncbi:uncharacterized protein G2W53_007264 [Senna tora]|uniref:Uncharacterized protein n=1 Tax=Senna tora TaxID=362788 RepID=A0A834X6M7_9FABA|nr:uncharacterized protein G2W53_007264 [Senna tora]
MCVVAPVSIIQWLKERFDVFRDKVLPAKKLTMLVRSPLFEASPSGPVVVSEPTCSFAIAATGFFSAFFSLSSLNHSGYPWILKQVSLHLKLWVIARSESFLQDIPEGLSSVAVNECVRKIFGDGIHDPGFDHGIHAFPFSVLTRVFRSLNAPIDKTDLLLCF